MNDKFSQMWYTTNVWHTHNQEHITSANDMLANIVRGKMVLANLCVNEMQALSRQAVYNVIPAYAVSSMTTFNNYLLTIDCCPLVKYFS